MNTLKTIFTRTAEVLIFITAIALVSQNEIEPMIAGAVLGIVFSIYLYKSYSIKEEEKEDDRYIDFRGNSPTRDLVDNPHSNKIKEEEAK